jgi:N-acetyl sugar amidotransferase
MNNEYQVCSRCVMDTTDPDIYFDSHGVCNHCLRYDAVQARMVTEYTSEKLEDIVDNIKKIGEKRDYDCIIGVSGGVDSTYVALKVAELGLRPLAVHLDNGWDSEIAVSNIHSALNKLNIDLLTHVIDWEEFRDLQVSFLKASTPDSEIPSDHAIVSLMYKMAHQLNIRYIISGYNYKTEMHLPRAWSQGHRDWRYIYSVQKAFGSKALKSFPHMSFWTRNLLRLNHEMVNILNYLSYSKKDAISELEAKLGWRYYGGKHYESIYTRFYQGYILPVKFGYDKRKSHLSSLICSGEVTREEAIQELRQPPYSQSMQDQDREYVIKKLELSEDEFEEIMTLPHKSYWDYPSYGSIEKNPVYVFLRQIYRTIRPGSYLFQLTENSRQKIG